MTFDLPETGQVSAFVLIVDINGFTGLVSRSEGDLIAQFVRDVLAGSIATVERFGGHVVGFMGDAILGVLPDAESTVETCFAIAKDVNSQCEYISSAQGDDPGFMAFAPGGPTLKIAIEYGSLDISRIASQAIGDHRLFIGSAINYAARILAAGTGNRCLIGPEAARHGLSQYCLDGPDSVAGKRGEPEYEYYRLDMGDIWIEGDQEDGTSYWS